MRTIYLLGVIFPVTSKDIEDSLKEHLGIAATCLLRRDVCSAEVSVSDEDFLILKKYQCLRVCTRLLAITSEDPTNKAGAPALPLPGSGAGAHLQRLLHSRNDAKKKAPNAYKVCLTGGPCAGKTTVLSTLMTRFNAHGVRTLTVPESATLLLSGGLSFSNLAPQHAYRYQLTILATTLDLERHFMDLAMAHCGPCLVVCYRGAMDGRAYCDEPTWNHILAELGVNTVQPRDQQYDAVCHLVTAANWAEEFYGNATNAVRLETAQQARDLDERTLNAYLGHPHLGIFDNSTDFATKVERVVEFISDRMGITIPTHGSYRRWLVRGPPPTTLPVPSATVDVEVAILRSPTPEPELRIIARQENQRCSYSFQKLRTVNGKPVLTERRLTFDEYQELRQQIDPDCAVIHKSSLAFTHNNQYFEMGTFINPPQFQGLALLYIEIGSHSPDPELPPFIPVEREVTDDPQFNDLAISNGDYGAVSLGRTLQGPLSPSRTEGGRMTTQRLSLRTSTSNGNRSLSPQAVHCFPARRDSTVEMLPFSWVPSPCAQSL